MLFLILLVTIEIKIKCHYAPQQTHINGCPSREPLLNARPLNFILQLCLENLDPLTNPAQELTVNQLFNEL